MAKERNDYMQNWRDANREKMRDYQKAYQRGYREQERDPIIVEKWGYRYTLLRAKLARLQTKRYSYPEYMGHQGYVLNRVEKLQ